MKILILNQILFTADNNVIPKVNSIKDTMIYGMCLAFLQLGHKITLAASIEYKPLLDEEYEFEIKFFRSNVKKLCPPTVLPFSIELWNYLKDKKDSYDLVVSSEVFSFPTLFAALLCPKKTLIWQELTDHQNKFYRIPSKIWHKLIAPTIINKVSITVPRSERAQLFIRKYVRNVSSSVVDHGININKFTYSERKERFIISSSQLIYRKNVDGIIRMFSRFTEMEGYEDIKLLIAGRGELKIELENLVWELNLQDKIEFLGFLTQRELNLKIRDSLCFLVNTRKDLNMVSIPEAIVSGTPILTNLQPASAGYIHKYNLGIAKDHWNEYDLKKIVDENEMYVYNCMAYRKNLTSEYAAQRLIEIFNTRKGKETF
ncbi:MAG: glycosyltransferase [Bacteroidaceae bacterium]|nr:glycosyltransferase [Bacteroidaceae bacterium]